MNDQGTAIEIIGDFPAYFSEIKSEVIQFLKKNNLANIGALKWVFQNSNGLVLRVNSNSDNQNRSYILKIVIVHDEPIKTAGSIVMSKILSISSFQRLEKKFQRYKFELLKDVGSQNYRQYLSEEKNLALAEKNKIAIDWILAVMELHAQSLIHRDLKPENFVRSWDGSAVLVDYDQTIVCDASNILKVSNNNLFGTPGYLPVESIRSPKNKHQSSLIAAPFTDVFALSSMLNTDLFSQEINDKKQYSQDIQLSAPLANMLYYFACLFMKLPIFFKKEKKQDILRPEFFEKVERGMSIDHDKRPSLDEMLSTLEPGLGDENKKYLRQRKDFLELVRIYKNKNFLNIDLNFSERCELLARAAFNENLSNDHDVRDSLRDSLKEIKWLDQNNQPTERAPVKFKEVWNECKLESQQNSENDDVETSSYGSDSINLCLELGFN